MSTTIDVTEELRKRAEARRDAREIRLLAEVANLHKVIEQMREHAQEAQKHCLHKGSLQALELKWAMELADQTLKGDDNG